MSFDPKCFELADAFLDNHRNINSGQNATELAQQIQNTIEDFIQDAHEKLRFKPARAICISCGSTLEIAQDASAEQIMCSRCANVQDHSDWQQGVI